MRIGIDAACWSNRRGFGRFTRELVAAMVRECPEHDYTLVVDAATAGGSAFPAAARLEVVATREQPTRAASAHSYRSPLDLWRLSQAASRVRADVFFFPAVYSFYPLMRRVPTVVTFHDAIADEHPELIFPGARSRLFWRAKTWLARRQADRLLTVSASARARLAAVLGCAEDAIDVISEGPSEIFRPLDDAAALEPALARHGLAGRGPIVLYVGGISPHKNLQRLLRAFLRAAGERPCHLAVVGDHSDDSFYGCYRELLELRESLALEDRVTFTGFVPNEDLVALYNAATLLVLPSVDEGFGLPVVEAMACGLPVAASSSGALPEVAGPAAIYFEPRDEAAMGAAIVRLLDDESLRWQMRSRGLERAAQYSWGSAARQAVRLFQETARAAA